MTWQRYAFLLKKAMIFGKKFEAEDDKKKKGVLYDASLEETYASFFYKPQKKVYPLLPDTYKENDLVYDRYSKGKLESKLAYDGQFKPYFEYIADCLKKYSSQRDKQKGEAFVHGFTLAMTSQNKFYRPISELDNDGGYADIFLSPLCDIYKDMVDSYIIELKYCKSQTTDEQVKKLFEEASAQISRYADSDMVREAVKTTKLHKLVVIYRGAEMVACEEI